ncbi:hypothetical protein M404DRAFT_30711 [Pisolithus tinctorius Marx 270]|uniref:Uncharacterized protein n=1 Tax=Pisolithus tinctorius Marx 270 TaxID=870435 RepID=A0A0C3NV52_PISTI|nr:hypothetical protein M404DRAFT_30711 [Pisolithus tinctorius Marx 270]
MLNTRKKAQLVAENVDVPTCLVSSHLCASPSQGTRREPEEIHHSTLTRYTHPCAPSLPASTPEEVHRRIRDHLLKGPMLAPTYATAAIENSPVTSLICAPISFLDSRGQYTGMDEGSNDEPPSGCPSQSRRVRPKHMVFGALIDLRDDKLGTSTASVFVWEMFRTCLRAFLARI